MTSKTRFSAVRVSFGAAALAVFLTSAPNAEESKPAVSDLNGKIAVSGGVLEQEGTYMIDASISAPIGHSVGVQFDGLAAVVDGNGALGGGMHVFWRDPDVGLLGGYASALASTAGVNYTVGNVGAQGAYYYESFSFEGMAGIQFGQNVQTEPFGMANIALYATDDLRLYGGYQYWFDEHWAAGGIEWQLPGNDNSIAYSLFLDGRGNDRSDVYATAGFRVYFGEHKTLIRRHREDDPDGPLPNDLTIMERLMAAGGGGPNLPPNCAVGDGAGGCIECIDGYFLGDGGTCFPATTAF